jgi:hypothetical protein
LTRRKKRGGSTVIEELSDFENNIANTLFSTELIRYNSGIEFISPINFRQFYTELRQNISHNDLLYSQLIPRTKTLQRNMSVFDNQGNELSIIPSDVIEKSLSAICDFYMFKAWEYADKSELPFISRFFEHPVDFGDIFCHDDETTHEKIKAIVNQINYITLNVEKIDKNSRCFSYIERIYVLVGIYEKLYIPFVKLNNSIAGNECFSLNYSIDKVLSQEKKVTLIRRKFWVFGFDTITINLEIEENVSNHIKILSPEGILFSHAGISGLQDENLIRKYGNLDYYLDNDMIYFNIPKKDSSKIFEDRRIRTEDPQKPVPKINLDMSVSKDFPMKLSLIRILVFLMYVSIFIPAIAIVGFNHGIVLTNLLGIAVLTLTIIIAIGIYSIDKPFLELYAAGQILLVIIFFIIECLCLYFKY